VIDFQDAVEGPITYDLVSLLRDCYIDWPLEKIEGWVKSYLTNLQQRNSCNHVSEENFMRWFDLMGVQRHLKAIGIFARLNYRDGKSGYLNDIPRTLNYVRQVSEKYEELAALHHLITSRILPAMKRTS
jgi:aminoglycoside/choline kinase family phosphotransferase